jgi:sn-glycerol 3-phosphate transport system substrate-binding protein
VTRRRIAAGVAGLAVAAMLAAACGGYGGNSASRHVSASNLPACPLGALRDATGTIHVSIWHGWTAQPKAGLDDSVKAFNAQQDQAQKSGRQRYRIHVTASQEGKDYDEVFDKYARAASSKQLPSIIQVEDTKLQTMADSSTVLPAESCMKADHFDMSAIQPAVRSYYTVRGVYWPGFASASELVLYYNRAHFARAGLDPDKPPGTLQELYDDARKLEAAGIPHPMSLKLDPWFLWTWLSGVGVDVVNHHDGRDGEATRATFNTPQAVQILELFKKMQREDLLVVVPKAPGNIDQYLALATQKSSMLIETSAASTTISAFLKGDANAVPSPTDTTSLLPASGPFPGVKEPGQVQASGAAMYIVDHGSSKAQQAASWEFLKFMMSKPQMVQYHLTTSYLPVFSGAANSPQVTRFWSDQLGGRLLKPAFDELSSVNPDNPGPLIGPYGDFVDALQTAWEAVMLQNQSPAHALAVAQRKVDAALTLYRQDNG